ncbi:MAG: cheW40H-5 [Rhodospirillales bacterium]|jgi:purine-binding chemotaxis protein CheW|nr:cheW40H-5 [Rhodospirillales bacterium]
MTPAKPSGDALSASTERNSILKERARLLARMPQAHSDKNEIDVIAFTLARETYAVELKFVREVYPLRDLTSIPCTPPFLIGIINIRGEMCAVVDLKRLLDLPESGLSNATRAVILQDGAMELGIIADVVLGGRSVNVQDIAQPPATLSGIKSQFLRGITPERLMILNAESILHYPQMVVNKQVEASV